MLADIETLKKRYAVLLRKAKDERAYFERLRNRFSKQCEITNSVEAELDSCKRDIEKALLEREGLDFYE